jgi:hypothetical protein
MGESAPAESTTFLPPPPRGRAWENKALATIFDVTILNRRSSCFPLCTAGDGAVAARLSLKNPSHELKGYDVVSEMQPGRSNGALKLAPLSPASPLAGERPSGLKEAR